MHLINIYIYILFKSCGLSCDHVPHNYEILKWVSSLPILMHKSLWWWQCSYRYIISPPPPHHHHHHHLHTPFSPSLINIMVFVDVKHHVYLLGGTSKMFLHLLGRGPRRFIGCRLWRCWAAVAPAGVEVAREAASQGSCCKSDSFSILWILESVSWTKTLPLEVHALDAPGWSDAHRNKVVVALGEVFHDHYFRLWFFCFVFCFSFRRFWMTCCIVFLDRSFTRIGLVLPALFSPTRWAVSMCSGVMCFRSSRL